MRYRYLFEVLSLICGILCYLEWLFHYPAPSKIRKDRDGTYRRHHRAVHLRHAAGYVFLPLAVLLFTWCLDFFSNTWLHWIWNDYLRFLV